MATKPTRQQDQACDLLARSLLDIAQAARLDGRAAFGPPEFIALAKALARASSAFDVEEIATRALGARVKAIGLRSDAVELLTLIDGGVGPIEAILADDEKLKEFVAQAEAELGEV